MIIPNKLLRILELMLAFLVNEEVLYKLEVCVCVCGEDIVFFFYILTFFNVEQNFIW